MKNNNTLKLSYLPLLAVLSILIITSCKKDEPAPTPVVVVSDNENINAWIEKQMRSWYLWSDSIPSKVDKTIAPNTFYNALLERPIDRFSFIVENYTDQLNGTLVSKESGYLATFYQESSTSNKIIGQVVMVFPNSPASNIGLKRGDIIYRINGTEITTNNQYTLIPQIAKDHTISYFPVNAAAKLKLNPVTKSISLVEYDGDPNYLSTVLGIGDRKIGYYVNNLLVEGTSGQYNTEMDQIFSEFKTAGITDLVIDLRYNNGGDGAATTNLASLIAEVNSATQVFYTDSFSLTARTALIADSGFAQDFDKTYFTQKSANVASQISNTVYILITRNTAAAAELLINGLSPYLTVYLIGDRTAGLNYTNGLYYEANNANNKWGIFPVISKPLNSLGENKYGGGFLADTIVNEIAPFIFALGDTSELLLNAAVTKILNGGPVIEPSPVRLAATEQASGFKNIYSNRNRPSILTLGRLREQALLKFRKN